MPDGQNPEKLGRSGEPNKAATVERTHLHSGEVATNKSWPARVAAQVVSINFFLWLMSGYAILGALVTLIGWTFNRVELTDWFADGISTMPNAALGTLLGAGAVLALRHHRWRGGAILGALLMFLGGITLLENLTGLDAGIDTLLLSREWGQRAATAPGRMGVPASGCFTILGIFIFGVSLSPNSRPVRKVAAGSALTVMGIALISIVGALFNAEGLHTVPGVTAIALPTSSLICSVAMAFLFAMPDTEPVVILTGNSAASAMFRRALPLVILIPIFIGLARVQAERASLVDQTLGTAIRTIAEMVLLGGVVWWGAIIVRRHERISERRESEARRQSGLINSIVESSDDAIIGKQVNGVINAWNYGAERMLGYTAQEAIGKHISLVLPERKGPEAARVTAQILRGERIQHFETERRAKGGRLIRVSLSMSPVFDGDGRIVGVSQVLRDISKQKLLEESLQQNEALFAALVQQAPNGVYVVDQNFRLVKMNAAAAPTFERIAHPIGSDFTTVMHALWGPVVGEECVRIFRHTLATGERYVSTNFTEERADLSQEKSYIWETQRIRLPNGDYGVVCYFEDVTESTRSAAALRASEERARLATEAAGAGIWEWNIKTGQIRCDAQILRMYGISPTTTGQIPYERWIEFVMPEDRAAQERFLRETIDLHGSGSREFRIVRAGDGEIRWIDSRETVRLGDDGRAEWVVGTNIDITERRRVEMDLAQHRLTLEARVKERTLELERTQEGLRRAERLAAIGTLAAGLGHDLTNMLLPIHWRIESLLKQDLSAKTHEDVADIADSMKYLEKLVAGLRHMAANPDAAPPAGGTDLAEWWTEVGGMFRAVLPRTVRLHCQIPIPEPGASVAVLPPVAVNRIGLTQAIFNIVQNAGEALMPLGRGNVTISASVSPGAGPPRVELTVSDDGPGMPPEVASRCFEPYFSTKERAVNTGMGLTLVRGVVETVGGSVEVQSTPGRGTVFTLRFHAAEKPAKPARPA
ncbi:MAG: PAS domain S-box protein [Phycisphaerales bacterium]|jgi:PAS domain S-box-containing protein